MIFSELLGITKQPELNKMDNNNMMSLAISYNINHITPITTLCVGININNGGNFNLWLISWLASQSKPNQEINHGRNQK